jgi:hypothetical protein
MYKIERYRQLQLASQRSRDRNEQGVWITRGHGRYFQPLAVLRDSDAGVIIDHTSSHNLGEAAFCIQAFRCPSKALPLL